MYTSVLGLLTLESSQNGLDHSGAVRPWRQAPLFRGLLNAGLKRRPAGHLPTVRAQANAITRLGQYQFTEGR
jgi:hypothetical protein